jgi:hypothetical protein
MISTIAFPEAKTRLDWAFVQDPVKLQSLLTGGQDIGGAISVVGG